MPRTRRRLITLGLLGLTVAVGVPAGVWVSLAHQPKFYRAAALPQPRRQERAKHFVAQSLQLRNDIDNEPRWEAVFTDEEVNAWLAEDLVTHFADQLPPEVREPRVVFEADRATLGFRLDQGPVHAVVWVVARVRVPEQNVLELTLEKIRAGAVPFPAEQIIDRVTRKARDHGLDVRWRRDRDDEPVALVRYSPDLTRNDVVLEQVQIGPGQIRLAGRSNRVRGAVVSPVLPRRKVLQSAFPRRTTQQSAGPASPPTGPLLRSSTSPTS